jgi:hypothetical protein
MNAVTRKGTSAALSRLFLLPAAFAASPAFAVRGSQSAAEADGHPTVGQERS